MQSAHLRAIRVAFVLLASLALAPLAPAQQRLNEWPAGIDRDWIGPSYWANRLQDWSLVDGSITATGPSLPLRTLHVLTRRVLDTPGGIELTVDVAFDPAEPDDALAGFWIGAGAPDLDPRARALVQSCLGPDAGVIAAVEAGGRLVLRSEGAELPSQRFELPADRRVRLTARLTGSGAEESLQLTARDVDTGRDLASLAAAVGTLPELAGNLALVADHGGGRQPRAIRFSPPQIRGSRIGIDATHAFGPIAGVMYTVDRVVWKLTAQLLPLADDEDPELELQVASADGWRTVATTRVIRPGYTAPFRVTDHLADPAPRFRVVCPLATATGATRLHTFEGRVRPEPDGTRPVVVAGFTGNHNVRGGFGRTGFPMNRDGLWFPHDDLTERVARHDPDLLFFSGDQVYEGGSPTPAVRRPARAAELDYLYKWLLFVWAFRDLMAERPTVAIPDDHDVYQGNIWGAGGRPAKRDHDGGYVMPADWVRMVERSQTSHLPDPFDPTPIGQEIGVYYTRLTWGGADFAILEDRKFKSGPNGLVPPGGSNRPDHITTPDYDVRAADVPGAKLLGDRQLAFLDAWARDWSDAAAFKVTLSQTVFGGLATHHGGNLQYLIADLDSNGWPQTGRAKALTEIRKGMAFMLGGDQHLATLARHGIDDWNDAGWSFAVPSIANFYPRMWKPPVAGANRAPGRPEWTGEHRDGLGNPVTMVAATNPDRKTGHEPADLHDRMPGYGVLRIDPVDRTITVECWPRYADPTAGDSEQYPGWPVTLSQRGQDGREVVAWLPEIRVTGIERPVIEVLAPDGSLDYAWRSTASDWRPWVHQEGEHVVRVGDPDRDLWQTRRLTAAPLEPAPAAVQLDF